MSALGAPESFHHPRPRRALARTVPTPSGRSGVGCRELKTAARGTPAAAQAEGLGTTI